MSINYEPRSPSRSSQTFSTVIYLFLIGLMMQDYSPFTFNSWVRRLSSLIIVDVSFAIDIRNHFAVQDSLIAHMKMCTCGYPWQFSRTQIAALNLVLKSSNMRQIQKGTFSVKLNKNSICVLATTEQFLLPGASQVLHTENAWTLLWKGNRYLKGSFPRPGYDWFKSDGWIEF